jgi:hypothetical protein
VALLPLRTHLLAVGFQLCLLLRREYVHDLRVQLLTSLWIGLAAARMRLTELLHERVNLLLLLIGKIEIREALHHTAVTVAECARLSGARLGLIRRLLCTSGNRKTDRDGKRPGKEERGEFHGPILGLRLEACLKHGLEKGEKWNAAACSATPSI